MVSVIFSIIFLVLGIICIIVGFMFNKELLFIQSAFCYVFVWLIIIEDKLSDIIKILKEK